MSTVLKLKRTQPVRGQPVTVFFETEGHVEHGRVTLPFDVWIDFSKILQKGIAVNEKAREQKLKIVIEGVLNSVLQASGTSVVVKAPPAKIRSLAPVVEEENAEQEQEQEKE